MKNSLLAHLGKCIVLDTDSHWVYMGKLEEVTDGAVRLADCDAHHRGDSQTTTLEQYIMDSRASGVKRNRESVFVSISRIVAFSPLRAITLGAVMTSEPFF